ncbi:hypothetical protein QF037_004583 [Streptomyces canus]|uniref:hypothetical protein n=1 Tax=Streptomyces canus TaxID=58343 RepID=UPI00278180EB|nr:hypothetical protein [Streptomyces canus]MDQ0600238.1 hypothetical protein [Streptomyces canus]
MRDLAAEQIPLGVRLTWTPPADDDVTGYKVWQGVTDPETGETVWDQNCWTGDSLARVVRLDAAGAEAASTPMAYGIWDSWL